MRSAFFKSAIIFTFFFAVGFFFTHKVMNPTSGGFDFSSRAPSAVPVRTWAVSAYLPNQLTQKVYLTIEGKQIKDISATKPAVDYILETETVVFPGLMDMHNHIKYNVLPLWRGGQSQYSNRYEWRGYAAYKDEVTGMMKGFDKTGVCAAFRWGELRALVGGTTSMQGGADPCTSSFGPMNIESKDEMTPNVIRAATDPLGGPEFMGNVFVPLIAPELLKSKAQLESLPVGDRQAAMNRLYDTTFINLLNTSGIMAWLESYANQPRSLRLGVKLLIGEDFSTATDNSQAGFDALVPEIKKAMAVKDPKLAKDTAAAKQIADMRLWLYGTGDGKSGYMNSVPSGVHGAALLDDSGTMEYFQKAGVISVDKKIRRYLAKFEIASRRSILKYYASAGKQAVVAHLSEGGRNDTYNKLEYQFASQLGFLQPGFVIIHGVGLDAAMLSDAAKKGVSIVWSPTSNLLLYGETLDVVAAKRTGMTIALGSDWGPSGTKSMLDEIKIARQYLNKMRIPADVISDKDIVEMATVNGAKALNLQNTVGQVKKGYLANLLFVSKKVLEKNPNPYSALIAAGENDVDLVVVGGEPVYGEQKSIEDVARGFRDATPPETITKCNLLQKSMRFPFTSKADTDMQAQNVNLRSVANIENILKTQFAAFKVKLQTTTPRLAPLVPQLDPMYPCEDVAYQNYMKNFISTTLDQNNAQRAQLRTQYRLKPGYNPMAVPASEDGGEDASQ